MVTDLLGLLAPQYTDDEQMGSKDMQKGFEELHRKLEQFGRVVLTKHGHPEAIVLSYQNVKQLSRLVAELVENEELKAVIEERTSSPSFSTVGFDEGITRIRDAWHATDER